jgi:hypothetical protein
MKNKLYTIILAAAALSFSSCSKDFLEKYPSEQISTEQLVDLSQQDPSILDGYLAGLYAKMYETGSGGTTGHDDFGQKGYDIYSDLLSGDMVLGGDNYGWYLNIANLTATENYTVNQAYTPWRYYYSVIFNANNVIETLGGNDAELSNQVAQHMMGQAKAMRAYAYFYLVNLYSREGYGTGNEKVLPIYTTMATANNPKSTTKEVYDLIIDDLTEAVELLATFNRGTVKHAIDKSVAQGLLSYALSARGTNEDLRNVVTITNEIIASNKFKVTTAKEVVAQLDEDGALLNPESGFNNVATPSWMWGVDLTLASDLDLISWWGQVDLFTYSYASAGDPKIIDNSLFDVIKDSDVRKGQFDEDYWPINKFFAPERRVDGQRYIVTDYVYMRFEEILLLNAEANAKLGNESVAKASLNLLLENRFEKSDDYAYVNNLTAQALLNEIYLQTRIELWGEGKSYLSLKRNKEKVTRGSNHLFHQNTTFNYNDPKLTFLIPQTEELNNPNLNK